MEASSRGCRIYAKQKSVLENAGSFALSTEKLNMGHSSHPEALENGDSYCCLVSCEAVSLREKGSPSYDRVFRNHREVGNIEHRQATFLNPFAGANKQEAKADWILG